MRTDHGLVSPEAVPLDLPEATVGSRGAALLIDWTLQGLILVVVGLAAQSAMQAAVLPDWVATTAGLVLTFLVWFGYPIAFETAWDGGGRTPGKAALGLRVVTVEGAPVRFRHAAVRTALGLVDFVATFGLGAVVSSLVSRRHQRLGDMVAGTLVVHVESHRDAANAPINAVLAPSVALQPEEQVAVVAFGERAPLLTPARQAELADIAEPLTQAHGQTGVLRLYGMANWLLGRR